LRISIARTGLDQLGGTFFGAGEFFRNMRIIGSGARIAFPAGRIALIERA
jgi:hypothetical protein